MGFLFSGCGGTAGTTFTIGGTVTGLTSNGLILQNNGGDNLTVSAGSETFTFATAIASGAAYSVSVFAQPSSPSQTCTVTNGSGAVASANITNVAVTCVTNTFTIGGTVSGLTGSGLVLRNNNNGADAIFPSADGSFTFAWHVK